MSHITGGSDLVIIRLCHSFFFRSEFVTAVGTFCMFGKIDLLKFCFYIFDKDKNGYIEEDELHCLIDVLQGDGGGYSNTKQAILGAFDGDGDGKMSFPEFCQLHAKYPQMLHPAFRLQDSIPLSVAVVRSCALVKKG